MVASVAAAILTRLAMPGAATATVAKVDGSPAWSPDGGRIAFVRATVDEDAVAGVGSPSQILCVIAPDGRNEAVVTGAPARISWSPKAGHNVLLYTLWRSAFLLDTDTLSRRELLRCDASEPAGDSFFHTAQLSLDGRHALIVTRGPRPGTRDVHILDVETGRPAAGSSGPFPALSECGAAPEFPLRSPAGSVLLQVDEHLEMRPRGSGEGVPLFLTGGMYRGSLRWSLDASSLTIALRTGGIWAAQINNGAVWEVSPAAGPARPDAGDAEEAPNDVKAPAPAGQEPLSVALSPSGARKAYFYADGLWVFTIASGARERLAQFGPARRGYASVAWSPDGKHLAYSWGGRIGVTSLSGDARFITGPPWKLP